MKQEGAEGHGVEEEKLAGDTGKAAVYAMLGR